MILQVVLTMCVLHIFSTDLRAQGPVNIAGQITDSSGVPVVGASVAVAGAQFRAMTDDSGQFRLSGLPLGNVELDVRRLGFVTLHRQLSLRAGQSPDRLRLSMSQLPTMLSPVFVRSGNMVYSGRLAGYYQRLQRRTTGSFISRDEIDRKNFQSLSQVLRAVPGINAFPLRSGGTAIRMRGRTCRPLVWLDGVPMAAAEVDIDAFPTSTLQGIELYLGSTSAPADFVANSGESGCGTILLWSRGRDTEPLPRRTTVRADLQELIEALAVFSADQVGKQAELTSGLEVGYPPDLFAEGVGGVVVAEFVVDTTGRVEPGTFSVVTSSDPRFSAAVQRAVANARYSPATKDGRCVRQAVQQPFRFDSQRGSPELSKQSINSR